MTKHSVDAVQVRMYRHGFGDCFLLQFLHGKERVFSMVIDCGIKHNTKSDIVPISKVMKDLKNTLAQKTGNPRIDVLVVTHEHWDHVAFFHPEDEECDWSKFEIGQVWLAWTENPKDKEAVQINSRLRQGAAALHLAAERLASIQDEEASRFHGLRLGGYMAGVRKEFTESIANVLGFYGVSLAKSPAKPAKGNSESKSGIKYKPNGKISVETEEAMNNVVEFGKKGGVLYLNPGTTVDGTHVPAGVNIHVLGPPRNSLIKQMNPSKGDKKETYLGIDHTGLAGFIDGIMQFGDPEQPQTEAPKSPFGTGVGCPENNLDQYKEFFDNYYFKKGEEHRRIDNAWLDATGQFALQLDGAINNTSLVLAIELAESGKVLLFPGDAQVGSWLSWHDCTWKSQREDKSVTLTAADLLQNTVLYKVSHHGSHNATVKDKGLEMMTHPDLVAMIPEKEKSYNGILYEPLVDRLNELCKGRVLISADSNYDPKELKAKRPAVLSAKEWSVFKSNLDIQPEYIEYTVK